MGERHKHSRRLLAFGRTDSLSVSPSSAAAHAHSLARSRESSRRPTNFILRASAAEASRTRYECTSSPQSRCALSLAVAAAANTRRQAAAKKNVYQSTFEPIAHTRSHLLFETQEQKPASRRLTTTSLTSPLFIATYFTPPSSPLKRQPYLLT